MIGLPIDASAHGWQIDMIILLVHILMLVLFIGWGIFFTVALIRFHKSRNPKADYQGVHSHLSSVLEVAVAVVEILLLVGLSIPFWARQVNAFPNRKDMLEVHIVAEQFAWNVHYPGVDGIFCKTDIKLMDKQSNPLGLDRKDPNAKDDFTTINQLHIPIGRPVLIHLSSKDVIHSFGVPLMRVKQDVIPGMSIPVWFTPTKTGVYEIVCSQLCGLGHYRMKGFITVQKPDDYEKWINEQASQSKSAGGDDFWN